MELRTATPWWLSAVVAVGLLFILLGERAFAHAGGAASMISYLGAFLLVAATALRAIGFATSRGERRRVELVLLLCQLGILAALTVYAFGPDAGAAAATAKSATDASSADRAHVMATIAWMIIMAASIVPLILAEVSLGTANRGALALGSSSSSEPGSDASVDGFRVRAIASSGLSVALAMAFLMVTCNVSQQRNIRRDVSYFRTSSPGSAAVNTIKNSGHSIQVLMFFPDVNEVAAEVRGYFTALADATGGKITIEAHDRFVSSDLAEKYKVVKDGTVVILRTLSPDEKDEQEKSAKNKKGKKAEKRAARSQIFTVDTDIKKARRNQLRTLDATVQKALKKVIRDRRIAYMTVGHGEINATGSVGPLATKNPTAKAQTIKTILNRLNYQVKDLTRDTLASGVPDDADIVLVMGPMAPFMDFELESLDAYLGQGGSLMIALDPQRKGDLGILSERLGVTFNPTPLADDSRPARLRRNIADNMVIMAREFSSHASVTTLASVGAREGGLPFVLTGSLDNAEFKRVADAGPDATQKKPKRTYVVTSSKNTFRDLDKNFVFSKGTEKRAQYNLVVAIEDPNAGAKRDGKNNEQAQTNKNGMRAMVFADVELFVDQIQRRALLAQIAFGDSVNWLGGEELYSGETISEKDVRIKHTRSRDAKWFYGTIVGAPLLILGIGIVVGSAGRRRKRRKS